MSAQIDVLAVLDAAIVGIVKDPIRERRGHRESLIAARAAVAELIEAADSEGKGERLRTALARVGGAA